MSDKKSYVTSAAYTIAVTAADYASIENARNGCDYKESLIYAVKHLLEEAAWKDCKDIKNEVSHYFSSRGVDIELEVSSPPQKA
mgnify:FL=1|tara:strand:- start:833 stop:1084 length:252 start_codon:yes stop_codon:yes gene_type:complete